MTTWISWPPDDPKKKFPESYWEGDPHNLYPRSGFLQEHEFRLGFQVKRLVNQVDGCKLNSLREFRNQHSD